MKKDLGKVLVLIFLLLQVNVFAYTWQTSISKNKAYVNENIYLKYECSFEDRGELYTIDFNPLNTPAYDLTLLNKKEKFKDGKRTSTFEYIAKLKQSGEIVFDFSAQMKKTSLESIVYASGSRDDDRGDDSFTRNTIKLQVQKVQVTKSGTPLHGDFILKVKKDEPSVKSYEPYHLDVKILGLGNFHDVKAIKYEIDGVKIFSQKPILNIKLTKNGYKGEWSQKFAFVSEKSFSIPAVSIEYFNKTLQKLSIEKIEVDVRASYKREELLDEVEKREVYDFSFMYYVLTFIAGFLVAKIKFKSKKIQTKESEFRDKIKSRNSLDELQMLLVLKNEKLFESIINSDATLSLSDAKRKALQLIEN